MRISLNARGQNNFGPIHEFLVKKAATAEHPIRIPMGRSTAHGDGKLWAETQPPALCASFEAHEDTHFKVVRAGTRRADVTLYGPDGELPIQQVEAGIIATDAITLGVLAMKTVM